MDKLSYLSWLAEAAASLSRDIAQGESAGHTGPGSLVAKWRIVKARVDAEILALATLPDGTDWSKRYQEKSQELAETPVE